MSKRFVVLMSLLAIFAILLAACAPAATPAPEEAPAEVMEEPAEEMEAESMGGDGEILSRVLERDKVVCGARTDLLGFGYLDESGRNIGFDIDLCRAVAAAVLGDPEKVEIVPLDAADRGPALQTAEVDVLSRNVTWTSSRDAQWGNFTIITFFDGQGFMVRKDSGIESYEDMEGATVCVTTGTTTAQNLADFYRERGMSYEAVQFADTGEVYGAYDEKRCDIATSDRSQLASVRMGLSNPDDHMILDGAISKEPLTAAVPSGDDAWFDIVKLTIFGLINAEELGVTQANVEEMKASENLNVRRLLGEEGDWGYSDLGLEADALAAAITAVGNYGELYDRYMGPDGIAFTLPRGYNELWSNGGLIYAPPVK